MVKIGNGKFTKWDKSITKNSNRNDKQLRIIINGYENFIQFLEDKTEYVDSYYLWDIVSSGLLNEYNPNIPLNMIIIKERDESEHLSIVCPSPGFSIQQIKIDQKTLKISHFLANKQKLT